MADLQSRIEDAINAQREEGERRASGMDEPAASITLISAWINGVEDALAEIAKEIKDLRATEKS